MIFFEFAKRNIRLHMVRSSLAMLGIVIGVVAIASMGILGNSVVLAVRENLSQVGDSVIVTPYSGSGMEGGFGGGFSSGQKISEQNYNEIARAAAPNVAIPILSGGDRVKIGSDETGSAIYGLNPDDIPVLLNLKEGGYIRGTSSCLVGAKFAEDHHVKIGSRVAVSNKSSLRVSGIIEERGISFDINTDSAIVVSRDW
ncbi:MAG TPA: ABC transporter permease, partial [Methanomicrobiales archaeon]|nr:ABC transporter permease [Methanomicrobiales archaeon]